MKGVTTIPKASLAKEEKLDLLVEKLMFGRVVSPARTFNVSKILSWFSTVFQLALPCTRLPTVVSKAMLIQNRQAYRLLLTNVFVDVSLLWCQSTFENQLLVDIPACAVVKCLLKARESKLETEPDNGGDDGQNSPSFHDVLLAVQVSKPTRLLCKSSKHSFCTT
jgi:hypothetical protein